MKQTRIGLLNEKPLHAALKKWYRRPGDRLEVPVDGFVIDIVRKKLLIEIQSGNFWKAKKKLFKLVQHHPVRLVYPITAEKWILRLSKRGGSPEKRRKSPKRGGFENVFEELVSFPEMLLEKNFSLDLLLIQEEEVRQSTPRRFPRHKGWVTQERRLLGVLEQRRVKGPAGMAGFLPGGLPEKFTTSHLAEGLKRPLWIGQMMAYCLRKIGVISRVGKQGNSFLYVLTGGG